MPVMIEGARAQSEIIRTKDPFKLEIFKGDLTSGRQLDAVKERVALVYHTGFGTGIIQTAKEVEESMTKGGSIYIVSKDGFDIAFSIQRLMRIQIPIDDKGSERLCRAVYTFSRLVLPAYQQDGVGKWTMEVEDEEYKPDYFTGRSQNPSIHLGWKSLLFTGEDRPIDRDYKGNDLRSRQYSAVMWGVVTRTSKMPVDINTGLAKDVYKEGETGGYKPDLSNLEYARIDQRMGRLGLVRANGDTLYYVIERVNQTQRKPLLQTP